MQHVETLMERISYTGFLCCFGVILRLLMQNLRRSNESVKAKNSVPCRDTSFNINVKANAKHVLFCSLLLPFYSNEYEFAFFQ